MTNDAPPVQTPPAWLANAQGGRFALAAACRLGRAEDSDLALPDPRVSRRHAMIHRQGDGEYWLVDFGSRNGTYLNGHRIAQPTRLRDGDRISLGGCELQFHQSHGAVAAQARAGDLTLFDVRTTSAWLLVADVIGSTRLLAELPSDELPLVMGRWLETCRTVIERHGGRINQFMGDGFFAYWPDEGGTLDGLLTALRELIDMQSRQRPAFRFVLHRGQVVLGGVTIGEEERISGSEVHFAFRMEKLAGTLGRATLVSRPARDRLAALVPLSDLGSHALAGFAGEHAMYAMGGPASAAEIAEIGAGASPLTADDRKPDTGD